MKTKLKLISVILLIALTLGTVLLFGGCTNKIGEVQIEVTHPITGEIITKDTVDFLTSIPENTPIIVKVKDLKTGKYLQDGDLTSGKTIAQSLSYSVATPENRNYHTPEMLGSDYLWPTEIGSNAVYIEFESQYKTAASTDPKVRQYRPKWITIEIHITGEIASN